MSLQSDVFITRPGLDAEDKRDATYVRYDMLVDLNANYRNRGQVLEKRVFYGQLQNIFVVPFPAARELKHDVHETYILAGIQTCVDIEYGNGMQMPYYSWPRKVTVQYIFYRI
ncbi:hypothetical protein K435DRAFT_881601 [Dendrothele bispora CBS 962.96]|uniref:Uncharacterized protein n=1 Tax=Dendrothele bispora (strain CBS 962.96) TaxID=1314807 RepID=A0A4S8KI64_DENBC|nr:hypothetical protein K435DRAFT_881601 [Dendrothele bispora CBS 962.96]